MKSMDKQIFMAILMNVSLAYADEPTRLKAINYALTGNDHGNIVTVDEMNCIYMARDSSSRTIYFLNRIQTSRTSIMKYTFKGVLQPSYDVKLYGNGTIYLLKAMNNEEIKKSKEELKSALIAMSNGIDNPKYKYSEEEIDGIVREKWTPRTADVAKTEFSVTLSIDDFERYKRAWTYIYSNGCVAAKDDF